MGSGNFSIKKYQRSASDYQRQSRGSLFQKSKIFSAFDPLKITIRESCASEEHSDPTSIIIACDVTGSMGRIPENLLKGGLGKIMESLMAIKAISNPQIMFAAVGDTECDRAPLQVTQFESDNRIEAQLKQLYLEGGGGGNNVESYHSIWYFAAYKTQLDSWKTRKKGLLFTMGDEMLPSVLKANHIRKFIDSKYRGADISTSQLLKDVTEKYDVFHLIVQDTNTYQHLQSRLDKDWKRYLGERAIFVAKYTDIPEKIISTVRSLSELSKSASISKFDTSSLKTKIEMESSVPGKIGLFKTPVDSSKALNKDSDNTPHLFICPISQDVMKDPVVAEDGYTYERKCIANWFQNHNTSPMTSQVIGKLLIPNHGLKSEINQWQDDQKSQQVAPKQ